jgi:PAS domain-containing protein
MLLIAREDITECKRVEQALRQSEAYLAEAQRLMHMGSWAYNHVTAKLTYFSDETFRLFGLDPRRGYLPELEEIHQLIHPEDRERAFEQLEQVFRDKAEYMQDYMDYRVVMPDGMVRTTGVFKQYGLGQWIALRLSPGGPSSALFFCLEIPLVTRV